MNTWNQQTEIQIPVESTRLNLIGGGDFGSINLDVMEDCIIVLLCPPVSI